MLGKRLLFSVIISFLTVKTTQASLFEFYPLFTVRVTVRIIKKATNVAYTVIKDLLGFSLQLVVEA